MKLLVRSPTTPSLGEHIDKLWFCEDPTAFGSERVAPTGLSQIVVPFAENASDPVMAGIFTTPQPIDARDKRRACGVVFRPGHTGAFGHFLQDTATVFRHDLDMTTDEATPTDQTPNMQVGLRLVVDDGAAAIDFYCNAFSAVELVRFTDPSGKIVHAEVKIGADIVSLSESDGDVNKSPSDLGGSATIAALMVDDADLIAERMVAHGGQAIFPVADREYGRRDGRYADPQGHLWLLTQSGSEDLSDEEVQRRLGS